MDYPSSSKRLLAVDLDGTLLRSDQTLSDLTIDVLSRARRASWHVVPVTARPPRFLDTLSTGAEIFDVAICCNGALIYDVGSGTVREHFALDPHQAGLIVRQVRDALPGACFAVEMGLNFGWDAAYAALPGALLDPGGVTADIELLIQRPVTKLLVRHPGVEFGQLFGVVEALDLSGCEVTHSTMEFLEVSRTGVDKAAALRLVTEALGLSGSEVVAFGDMPNDLPMLGWAGYSVAVANAHPDVLRVADAVTRTNDEDGVAVMVGAWLSAPDSLPPGRVPDRS